MGAFIYRGPLPPQSPLFRGRVSELAQLSRLCQGEVQSFAIVYGGRQTGKTSLLQQLEDRLIDSVQTCRIDFQTLPGATTPQAVAFLTNRLVQEIPSLDVKGVREPPDLIDFLRQAVQQLDKDMLVLLLEELGALPRQSREELAHVIRSIFTNRFAALHHPLTKLMIVLAGGIELYELAATQVSPLQNICEPIYLPDLRREEAIELITDTLTEIGHHRLDAQVFGERIYKQVNGHPYLTQRLGGALESVLDAGDLVGPDHVDLLVAQVLCDDPLLRHLRKALNAQRLLRASRALLDDELRFSRLDEEMAQLELLGLAKEKDGYWIVRNQMLARALREWFAPAAAPVRRCADLAENIRKAYDLLRQYEQKRLLATDPIARHDVELQIRDLKEQLEQHKAEAHELGCNFD